MVVGCLRFDSYETQEVFNWFGVPFGWLAVVELSLLADVVERPSPEISVILGSVITLVRHGVPLNQIFGATYLEFVDGRSIHTILGDA
jgi:2-hydroxychromene-2-carboxylate isomerase